MPLKFLIKKYPAKIRMINECDTEKVPNFPLEKIGSLPKRR